MKVLLGALVFFITYFNLSLRVDEFDQAIARLGPAGPTVQASLGPGCTCRLPQLHGMLFQTCFSQLVELLLHSG